MSNVINLPNRDALREQAGVWIVRLQEGLSPEQIAELKDWLGQGDEYGDALLEMADTWDEAKLLTPLADVFPVRKPQSVVSEKRFSYFAVAASIVAVIGIVWAASIIFMEGGNSIETFPVVVTQSESLYESAVGERSIVNLPDGSTATLNTRSSMSLEFSDTERKIILMSGEIHFKVSRDAARPFVVKAGDSTVRAIGTAFNVFLSGAYQLEVAVSEGTVSVHSPSGGMSGNPTSAGTMSETRLSAGEIAKISGRSTEVRQLSELEMTNRLSWQTGMLMFEDEPLADVIRELRRYTDTRLILEDDALGEIRVAGYFKVGDVDALMIALKENFDISFRKEANNTLVLSRM
jgi:transmembrane sensor